MAKAPDNYLDHTYIMILCGGGGTRLWPRSRKATPKQFINFFSHRTLYQEAVERARMLVPKERVLVITNKDYVNEIREQSPWVMPENILAEPLKKNTALAMGVAAAYVYKRDPEAVIVNFASDHTVEDSAAANKTVLASAKAAYQKDILVSVGIKPTFPHTGYGYIRVGEVVAQSGGLPVLKGLEFKEKPDLLTAEKFLREGGYFWNANWYTWSARAILTAFAQLAPELNRHIETILGAIGTPKEKAVLEQEYAAAQEEQIDTAISEKAKNLVVIPGEFGWNDVGSWSVVYDLGKKDRDGNVIIQSRRAQKAQEVLAIGAKNCLIHHGDQLVALVGVEGLAIIDTEDALLVCKMDKAQDVKKIVERLKEEGKEEYL